jgi:hypothetical protein
MMPIIGDRRSNSGSLAMLAAMRRASSRVSSLGAARSGPAPALFGHGPRADADHRRGCRNYTAARQLGLKPPWALRVKDLRALSHDRGRLLMILGEAGKPSTTAVHVVFGAYFWESPVKATLTFQPMFSQFCPAVPNSNGFGLSQQYDSAIPTA